MTSLLHAAEGLEADAAQERIAYFQNLGVLGIRILDVGCGNGYSVRELQNMGVLVVGVDCSFYRLSRWLAEGRDGRKLVIASAAALPFASGQFDTVISSGMLEHIGVAEEASPYRVSALPNKLLQRGQAVSELSRASSRMVVLDFPNGWFPVDFWHGNSLGAFRMHGVPDPLNPSLREVRSYLPGSRIKLLPLRNRLRFRQIARHWWGRLLTPAVQLILSVLDRLPRRTPLLALFYPFLVVQIEPARSNKALQRTGCAVR